ncbi:YdcF family protein, partial [Candidatus Omnitrophota bacterium]
PSVLLLTTAAARKNSWSNKVSEMSLLIEKAEGEKARQREASWKGNIARFYKKTGRKFAPLVLGLAVVYLAFFHTPLIWFLARPLLINDAPEKADVIVALAGGVGESGKVGQGYQERMDTAVRLYDQDISDKILYSSGFRYLMKEAEMMRALSVAKGVEAEDIVLDDTPVTTSDMIVNLKSIKERYGWKKIILVSSPYHMLRLKLLCDKHLKGIKVFYVPVRESSFYDKGGGIKMRHIRGIIQEYLAILYYKLKDYI